jgi:hypothetical protein
MVNKQWTFAVLALISIPALAIKPMIIEQLRSPLPHKARMATTMR